MRRDRMGLVAGIVYIVLGVVFGLERLGVFDVRASFVLPVVLVTVGLALLLGRSDVRNGEATDPPTSAEPATHDE